MTIRDPAEEAPRARAPRCHPSPVALRPASGPPPGIRCRQGAGQVPAGDPDTKCGRSAREPKGWIQLDGLSVDARMHRRRRRTHIQGGRRPGSPRRVRSSARRVEDHDSEQSAVECRATPASGRAVHRIGVVGHDHDQRVIVLAPRRRRGAAPASARWVPAPVLRSPGGCAPWPRGTRTCGPPHRTRRAIRC